MKNFVSILVMCQVVMFLSIFFLAGFLFSSPTGLYILGAIIGAIFAIIIYAYMEQGDKIEKLEKRIKSLEDK